MRKVATFQKDTGIEDGSFSESGFRFTHCTNRLRLPHFQMEITSMSPNMPEPPLYYFGPSCVASMRRCLNPSRPQAGSE